MTDSSAASVATAPPTARAAVVTVAWPPPLLLVALALKALAIVLGLATRNVSLAAFVFFAPDPFVLHAVVAPSAQGLCRVYTRFATARREVWLTIDDGPDENDTPRILDLLDAYQARATFFVIGQQAARYPDLLAAIMNRGHEIAHHTYSHPAWTFWCASRRRLEGELDSALAVLRRQGITPRYFRAPVGIKNIFLAPALARRELKCVGWTIRSGDCRSRSPNDLVAEMTRQFQPGAIILLHEGPSVPQPVRLRGTEMLLRELSRRGYACVIPDESDLRA